MKVYVFIGNEKDLEKLGYTNIMGMYWKITNKFSIIVSNNVYVKINGEAFIDSKDVKPYISELIENKLVKLDKKV